MEERVAQSFAHIYGHPGLNVVPLDLVTGPALDVQLKGTRHVLMLDSDAGQIAGIRVVASPGKLPVLEDQRRS